jgi:prepilin-type N-terminal cleavage/methylation domain-containing protein
MKRLSNVENDGFTIIETLIALAVFGTMLVIATSINITINNLYSKGIAESSAQDEARNIINQITTDLELTPGALSTDSATTDSGATIYSYCLGNDLRYSFSLGYRIGTTGATETGSNTPIQPHAFWRDTQNYLGISAPEGQTFICPPVNITTTLSPNVSGSQLGSELMSTNSRLDVFCIGTLSGTDDKDCTPSTGPPYNVSVGISYGSLDLLNGINLNAESPDATCSGGQDDQQCATALLNTTVVPRTEAAGN